MKKPTLTPVESSHLDAIGFDDRRGLLVRFKGGGLYAYPDAPKSVHDEMLKAESAGQFFRAKVRGKFNHLAVDG